MRPRTVTGITLLAALALPAQLVGQSKLTENTLKLDDDAHRPPATIDDVAWIAGSWVGEGFGGNAEEMWTAPSAGSMVGSFKLMHGGEVTLYEIELIVEEEGSLTFKVKHFTSAFEAWEEKAEFVPFPLVRLAPDTAYFSGLTVRRTDPDGLEVIVVAGSEGEVREQVIRYRRAG